MSVLVDFWDLLDIEDAVKSYNSKTTTDSDGKLIRSIQDQEAKALANLITDYCECLMWRTTIIPDERVKLEIRSIVAENVLNLVNQFFAIQNALSSEAGKSHAQSSFKPYAKDRQIDSDLISFTPQLVTQNSINIMRDTSRALNEIYHNLELITQKIIIPKDFV